MMMSRKRPPSEELVERLTASLDLSSETVALMNAFLKTRGGRQSIVKSGSHKSVNKSPSDDTQDLFAVLSEWHCLALLSLLDFPDANLTPEWVAKKLGIPLLQARFSIERLKRTGMIVEVEGRWRQARPHIRLDDRTSTIASRRLQRQFLSKAIASLQEVPPPERDITTNTFSMNTEDIEWAVEQTNEFRRELSRRLEQRSKPNSVYNISIQLYPLTKEKSK